MVKLLTNVLMSRRHKHEATEDSEVLTKAIAYIYVSSILSRWWRKCHLVSKETQYFTFLPQEGCNSSYGEDLIDWSVEIPFALLSFFYFCHGSAKKEMTAMDRVHDIDFVMFFMSSFDSFLAFFLLFNRSQSVLLSFTGLATQELVLVYAIVPIQHLE